MMLPDDRVGALCRLFANLLERPAVAPEDDFFVLGGHSILATRLVNRIRDEFHVELPLHVLFEYPTPAELSAQVGTARPARRPVKVRPGRTDSIS